MTKQLSKSERIRKMLHLSNKDIAEKVGCSDAYVRSVRQRTSKSGNPITGAASSKWYAANNNYILAVKRAYYRKRRAEARAS